MKLLWLKYGELFPLDTGGKLRSFHLLRELSRHLDLTFVSYADGLSNPEYPRLLHEHLPGSRHVHAPDMPPWRTVSAGSILRSVSSGAPLNVTRFASSIVKRQILEWLSEERFDAVLCDFLTPTLSLPPVHGLVKILFEHNVESLLWARRAATQRIGVQRALFRYEAAATLRWERRMLSEFDLVLAVSEEDKRHMHRLAPGSSVEVVETGVDIAEFRAQEGSPRKGNLVVFVGSMDWHPNEDGVLWFVQEVWPQVVVSRPDAVFRVVGRRPSPRIQGLRDQGIEVTGDVDSVVPHLREAAITVVPLRAGGGTRLKIFEAMAAGVPVISTTVGAEGLPVVPGADLVIADDPQGMATEILDLLGTRDRRERIAAHASATVERYDWGSVAERLASVLRAASAHGPRPGASEEV